MAKYVVRLSAIFVPTPEGAARRAEIGEVVDLDAAAAKHFIKIGRLDPLVVDDEAGPEGTTEAEAKAQQAETARRRRPVVN